LMWVMGVALWFGGRSAITLNMVGDPVGHLTYLPVFLFGVGLACSDIALTTAQRLWKPALALALSSYTGVALIRYQWLGETAVPEPWASLMSASHAMMGWTMIVALVGLAGRYLNHDHRWRPMLTEAVFPFYIIHQTIIVVVGWWLLRFALPAGAAFIILLAATVGSCWAFYRIGRSIPWLRPLIGLRKLR
jgi:glucans biosynthesis protein C